MILNTLKALNFWTLTPGYLVLLKGIALKPRKSKDSIEFERSDHIDGHNMKSKESPRYLLAIPCEELAVVLFLCIVDDVQ